MRFQSSLVLVAALVGCGLGSCSFSPYGPCGRDEAPASGPAIKDPKAATARNEALLQSLPRHSGAAEPELSSHNQYRCHGDASSAVVEVSTSAQFALANGATKCEVIAAVIGPLERNGWIRSSLETPDLSGSMGFAADLWRNDQHVTFGVGSRPTGYRLSTSTRRRERPAEPELARMDTDRCLG